MQHRRALGTRLFARTVVAALAAAALIPLAQAPAAAAVDDALTVSGRVVAEESATYMVEHGHFTVWLSHPGEDSPVVTAQFNGPDFSITAPEPGVYTVYVHPTPMADPSIWTAAWYGDTPFPWHATEITVDGVTPVAGLTITVAEGGTISGSISYPMVGLVYGLTADAFLLDPATGQYELIARDSRDFAGLYTIHTLPAGTYVVRFGHNGGNRNDQSRMFPSEFYAESRYLADAQGVEVPLGGAITGVDGQLDYWSFDTRRTWGTDRYETAVRISVDAFDEGVPAVYLASGGAWADALSAAPAAAHRGGPLLLTAPDHVPEVVRAELDRLQPAEVIVAGGPTVVSQGVLDALAGWGYAVRRVAGTDRYDTSRKLALDAFGEGRPVDTAWLATGHGFADALSAASNASYVDIPLVLVDGAAASIDELSLAAFAELGANKFWIAGGPAAVSDGLFGSLASAFDGWVSRYAGSDRYETSRLIAEQFGDLSYDAWTGRAFVASGVGYADALAAAPVAGLTHSPLFLTPGTCVPEAALDSMVELDAFLVELVGGPAVLGAGVEGLAYC
jgi:putative cell wall-binding protein